MKTEAETGMMWPQEAPEPREARRAGRRPLEPAVGAQPCPQLDLGPLTSGLREEMSVVLSPRWRQPPDTRGQDPDIVSQRKTPGSTWSENSGAQTGRQRRALGTRE